jgi:uncharacterized membrane protein YiaA
MKTKKVVKIVASIAIFIGMIVYLIGLSKPAPLDEISGIGKYWISFFIFFAASVFAMIPWIPDLLKMIFYRSWEK